MKPRVVLETGVGYGVTTAFFLKALEVNQRGTLYSMDLPPLVPGADRFVGILVPESLRSRWRLHRGLSRRLLPSLLPELGEVEIFLHDSLHTWSTMYWEFQTVMPYLTRPGMIVADDVDDNPAFLDWVNSSNPAFWALVSQAQKEGFFGVSVHV
ncbi:MAG: class I SAM-dependent methyltransferase [Clostridia bacterium]|nr:class I SAM-dependent methyltransferase [Clostridia bacterium]